MKIVNKYKEIIKEWFYLDNNGIVRRAKDGYHGRYKKDDIVKPYKLCSHGYEGVHIPRTRTTVPFHHLLLVLQEIDIPENTVIDHINGNTTDNRIENIRITSQSYNARNARKKKNNTSGVTGINITKSGLYIVRKQLYGKRVYLGCRHSMQEAVELLKTYSEIIKSEGYTERHGK